MCSIMGVKGRKLSVMELTAAFAATTSRGPDKERILELPEAVLGFQRLSIMKRWTAVFFHSIPFFRVYRTTQQMAEMALSQRHLEDET